MPDEAALKLAENLLKTSKMFAKMLKRCAGDISAALERYASWKSKLENSKSTTLPGFIERYGNELGLQKYQEMCDKIKYNMSLDGFIERYGKDIGPIKHKESIENRRHFGISTTSKESFIKKYGEELGIQKHELLRAKLIESAKTQVNRKNPPGNSLEKFIERHGEELGTQKHASMKHKMSKQRKGKAVTTKEHFINKWGPEIGLQKYNEKCKKISVLMTGRRTSSKEAFIKKYGIELGTEKYELFLKRCSDAKKGQPSRQTLPVYIEKFGKEEGTYRYNKWRENMSKANKGKPYKHSLEKFIERWGEKEGQERYDNYRERRIFVQSLEGCIEKHGEIKGTEIFNKRKKQTFSKISQELFWLICNHLSDEDYTEVYFAEHLGEYVLVLDEDDKNMIQDQNRYCFKLDFKFKGKIIEFDGTYWHSLKPEYDKKRLEIIKKHNFEVLIVEEKDFNYKNKSEEIIQKCIDFLRS